ncbi:MAG: glycosyltransferase family 1 protein, partial [Nitrospirae bacterium]
VICRKITGVPEWNRATGPTIKELITIKLSRHDLEAKSIMNILISLNFCFALMGALIRHRRTYDIVHFHGASLPLILNLFVLKLMKKKIIAKVTSSKSDREVGSFKGRYWFIGDILIRILGKVDFFIAISGEIKAALIKDGIEERKIIEISNFIKRDEFFPETDAERKKIIKNKLGIDISKRIITLSGRLVHRKRVDVLLEAVAKVLKTRKDIQVIILGHGELMNDLLDMAADLKIQNYVSFRGMVSNILDYLHVTDIFVFTSEIEGMPNSLLEAMACRLPVIATRIGGVVDIIEDGENGIIVTPGNAEELKEAILRLIENSDLAETIAENAYKKIKENYYIGSVADKYIQLYQKVLEGI